MWTWTAVFVWLLIFAGMLRGVRAEWTVAERLYLSELHKSGAQGRGSAAVGQVHVAEAVSGKMAPCHRRRDREVPSLDGRPGYRLTEEGVKTGWLRLTWVTEVQRPRAAREMSEV